MHHTRKNRSLKKKSKALKKKSNKSSRKSNKSNRKSKKSRRVHKRRSGGGFGGILVTAFVQITEDISNSKDLLSKRIDEYIAATKHVDLSCKKDKACNLNKVSHYGNRALLGESLQTDPDYKDVSDEQQKALVAQTNEWGRLAIEKKKKVDYANQSAEEKAKVLHDLLEDSGFNPSSQS